ncbi:MAG: phytanoyl-CoA dioxygenase family protein [Planctomycetales bacterium]|nr:phytanoyl-CoA dioxygenase family protein [Planctomycetales bacterium]
MLSTDQEVTFRQTGHVTVVNLFSPPKIAEALADIEQWSSEFLRQLPAQRRDWYLERADTSGMVLRKLDEPVYQRPVFQAMAKSDCIVAIVEQLIGPGVSVFFSQVFCKAPNIGGPKPVHQDNFYFGPNDLDATLTVWIALDDATIENGCLYYADGSQLGPVYDHVAPADAPFNLQIPADKLADFSMTPAPVPAGGVSFHHGNTWHQSSNNSSVKPRRAVAMHFLRNDAKLIRPALDYDPGVVVRIS